ncbi:hypothetical protein FKM82_030618 [Ascaphus truei]
MGEANPAVLLSGYVLSVPAPNTPLIYTLSNQGALLLKVFHFTPGLSDEGNPFNSTSVLAGGGSSVCELSDWRVPSL